MSDEPAEIFNAEAVKWIDGLSDPSGLRGSWRLQMLEHRVTVRETGVDPETGAAVYSREMRPVRLVRFAKGCPWALVPEAERYLLSLAPYTGRIVNGVDIPGTYKPTRTRWIRDDQTNLDDPRRSTNENRHTLVQDLVEASASDGDSVPQSSDCVETVTAEYHWDEPSLPDAADLPAASQGVAVSVQQVSRQEDGTYRYAIVTRTAKTRAGTEAAVECNAFQSVTQQDFTNLYGDPGTGFEDEAGNAVEVPLQTCGTGGASVEWRNLRQNDDCTWNVSVVTTEAADVKDVERTSSETVLERRDTRKDAAQAGPLQHVKAQDPAVSTAEGHVWEQRSELRPDGLYDNTVTRRDEKQLAGQIVEKRRTVRGTTVRTVNRNMPSAAADPTGIGAVVNTVTDSGRVTQEITEVDRNARPVDAGSACSTTVFDHVESDRTVRPDKPDRHWRNAGGGHRYERTSRITEEGSYEVVEEDHEELPKTGAVKTWRKTLRGVQETTVDRNSAAPLAGGGLKVGESRTSELTPGGLYNNTTVVTTKEPAGKTGGDCAKTVFEHTDSETVNQVNGPSGHVEAAGGGKTHRRTSRMNEEGTWDVVTVTTEELKKAGARVTLRKTLRGTQKTVVDRNVAAPLADTGLAVGETRDSEVTPGGLYVTTKTVTTAEAAGEIASESQKTVFEHRGATTENVAADPGTADASTAANGVTEQVSVRKTEEGTFDVTVQTTEEQNVKGAVKTWRKTLRGTVETTTDRSEAVPLDGAGIAVGETRRSEMTSGGLWNNTVETATTDDSKRILSESCERTSAVHTDVKVETMAATDPDAVIVDTGDHPTTEVQPNRIKRVIVRRNEDGVTVDRETLEAAYIEQQSDATSDHGGVESVTTVRKTNATVPAAIDPDEDLDTGGRVPPNIVIEVDNQPNDHGSFTTMKRVTEYEEVDSRTITGGAVKDIEYSDDEHSYVQRSFANQPELAYVLPGDQEIAGGQLSLAFRPNGHGSWDGGYTLRKARTDYGSGAVGKVIIDEGKNVQFSKTRRYGLWSYAIVGTITWIYWVWEFRRVCSFRFRVVGLTETQADSLVTSLSSSYTRSIEESVQNIVPSQQDGGGWFDDLPGGEVLMTKVFKYHIEGDVWGVRVVVNEQNVKLRGQYQGHGFSPRAVFNSESNWSYPVSGSAT